MKFKQQTPTIIANARDWLTGKPAPINTNKNCCYQHWITKEEVYPSLRRHMLSKKKWPCL